MLMSGEPLVNAWVSHYMHEPEYANLWFDKHCHVS
jgi:hypothetical protein